MAVNLHIKNLPPSANNMDIRNFFSQLAVEEGGVVILGGKEGNAFVSFCNDEDLLNAISQDGARLRGHKLKLLLATDEDVIKILGKENMEKWKRKRRKGKAKAGARQNKDQSEPNEEKLQLPPWLRKKEPEPPERVPELPPWLVPKGPRPDSSSENKEDDYNPCDMEWEELSDGSNMSLGSGSSLGLQGARGGDGRPPSHSQRRSPSPRRGRSPSPRRGRSSSFRRSRSRSRDRRSYSRSRSRSRDRSRRGRNESPPWARTRSHTDVDADPVRSHRDDPPPDAARHQFDAAQRHQVRWSPPREAAPRYDRPADPSSFVVDYGHGSSSVGEAPTYPGPGYPQYQPPPPYGTGNGHPAPYQYVQSGMGAMPQTGQQYPPTDNDPATFSDGLVLNASNSIYFTMQPIPSQMDENWLKGFLGMKIIQIINIFLVGEEPKVAYIQAPMQSKGRLISLNNTLLEGNRISTKMIGRKYFEVRTASLTSTTPPGGYAPYVQVGQPGAHGQVYALQTAPGYPAYSATPAPGPSYSAGYTQQSAGHKIQGNKAAKAEASKAAKAAKRANSNRNLVGVTLDPTPPPAVRPRPPSPGMAPTPYGDGLLPTPHTAGAPRTTHTGLFNNRKEPEKLKKNMTRIVSMINQVETTQKQAKSEDQTDAGQQSQGGPQSQQNPDNPFALQRTSRRNKKNRNRGPKNTYKFTTVPVETGSNVPTLEDQLPGLNTHKWTGPARPKVVLNLKSEIA